MSLVERLREFNAAICRDAADEIEWLRNTVVAADREIKHSHVDADRYRAEIERLTLENWQLKGALGYPVPGSIPDNGPWKCGLCDAKTIDLGEAADEIERLRIALVKQTEQNAYPCSPHCAAYLREQAAQGEIERLKAALKEIAEDHYGVSITKERSDEPR